jgi:ABC-2 type transport system permease protein
MEYRASFVIQVLAYVATIGVEFLAIWALFDRFGNLRGWTLAEAALFYGIVHIAFALAEGVGRGFDVFHLLVKSGDFDRLLLRPRGTALQVAGMELQLMRVGRLSVGLAALSWSISTLSVEWTAAKLLLICAAIVGGACLFYGLFILQATLAFWTVESLEIVNTVTYGGAETAQFPLTIYSPWFRRFFTFVVPLAFINYIPASAILDHPDLPSSALAWAAPAVGLLFLLVCLRVWHSGVRHYRSTGS